MGTLAGTTIAAALFAVPAPAQDEESVQGPGLPARVSDEVIVQFERGTDAADRADARADAGTEEPENLGSRGLEVVRIADADSVGETIRELESDPAVRFAEPNGIDQLLGVPNDPLFGQLWGMENTGQSVAGTPGTADADIDAPAAWDIGVGEPSTVIAIMDTGAALNHADLAPQLWQNPGETANGVDDDGNGFVDDVNGYDFVSGDSNPTDVENHGTHVSGIALARGEDGVGVTGVSQRASLMVLRVCGEGDTGCPQSAQIAAINYAAAEGADILNGSVGGPSSSENSARRSAIFSHPQVLHVFAAGNDGDDVDTPPATFPCAHAPVPGEADNTLCVASTTSNDVLFGGSNFGAKSVDLGAPGRFVLSSSILHDVFFDRFEAGDADFAVNWPVNGGWERTNEDPLAPSFGTTDSEGGDYPSNSTVAVTSRQTSVAAGYSACDLLYVRSRDLASGDTARIEVLRNDIPVFTRDFDSSDNDSLDNGSLDIGSSIAAGGDVRIRLTLISANDATQADGVHFDNMRLQCEGNGYEYLSGTSMASPHVAGTAGLLASRNPGADGPELRNKILATVDPLGSLSGTTVSGGRLNAGSAMAAMPADTSITGGPAEGSVIGARSAARRARAPKGALPTFSYSSNDPSAGFQCSVDGAAFAPCAGGGQRIGPLGPGPHLFAVRSVDPRGNADTTPALRSFSVETDPPETKITKSPKKRTGARKARFRFKSDERGSTFDCRIDKKKFTPCNSPRKFKRLRSKRHRFKVIATDAVGNVDPTAAKKRWRVKR